MELVGLIIVAVSVLLLAWQTRAAVRQTQIAHETAVASVSSIALLQSVLAHFLTYPELKPYFYSGKDTDALSPENVARVDTLAEMLGDTVEAAIEETRQASGHHQYLEDWTSYAQFLLDGSPALRRLVAEHPEWYRQISAIAATGAVGLTPRSPQAAEPQRTSDGSSAPRRR